MVGQLHLQPPIVSVTVKSVCYPPFPACSLFALYLGQRVTERYWARSDSEADLLAGIVVRWHPSERVHVFPPLPNQSVQATAASPGVFIRLWWFACHGFIPFDGSGDCA
jgi:hypothetical protein